MQIVIEIPDELAPTVVALLENKEEPDDDGASNAHINHESGLTLAQFVVASFIADSFCNKIEQKIREEQEQRIREASIRL